jgi:hypothetical protein
LTRAHGIEWAVVVLLAAAIAAWLPLSAGYFGWSWDALNHHVYLGLVAEHPRWDLDVLAASVQTYQYPYAYWPVYRLSLLSGSGAWLGAAWAGMQGALVAMPVWCVSLRLLRENDDGNGNGNGNGADVGWPAVAQRAAACALAFMSFVVLAGMVTTASDILAAVPLLWAVAVSLGSPQTLGRAFASAALWGMAVALKLSNAFFLPLLVAWWWQRQRPHLPLQRALALAAGATLGFGLLYAPWGWSLWRHTGNPFYPYLNWVFHAG